MSDYEGVDPSRFSEPDENVDRNTGQLKECLVSSRMDEIFDKIANGTPIQTRIGMSDDGYGNSYSNRSVSEPYGQGLPAPEDVHIDMDGALKSALMALGPEQAKEILQQHYNRPVESMTTAKGNVISASSEDSGFQITKAQYKALVRFPALIEFLGTQDGEMIAQKIASEMTHLVVDKIGENSKSISKFAVNCQADKRNIKQYFKGPDWVCRVTASGPFRGDEFIFYDKDRDVSKILRKSSNTRYANVSDEFNLIHEYTDVEPEEAPQTDPVKTEDKE